MKTLAIPSSGIVISDAGLSMSSDLLVLRSETFLGRSRKFLHLASARQRSIQPIFCLSAEPQVDIETADSESQEICQSKTVHVKFQIQKECAFGDELVLVGDDPMFGLWDPDNGVPLTWSEGHVWAVEMDMPIRKTIQFKFILKANTGTIIWQEGPDRTFQSWETNNTITVCEDWEDTEQQKLIEDDGYPSPNHNEDSTANSEVSETSNGSSIANNSSYLAEKCLSRTPEELVFTSSNLPQEVKSMAIVADNIGNPKKDYVVNAANEVLNDNVAIPNKGKVNLKDSDGRNDRVAAVNRSTDVDESQITCEGGPVLVPGLTSSSSMVETEVAVQFEGEKSSTVGASDGPDNAKNSIVPELEKKRELDGDETSMNVEEVAASLEQQPLLAKAEGVANEEEHEDVLKQGPLEEQARSVPNNNEVIINDIEWGRRALQKLLANLGLGLGLG